MMAQMQGTVSISKSGLCVEYLEISSPGPVKPQIGVKVNHFLSRFEFAPVGEPEQLANVVVETMREERFHVLPHPEVEEYVRRKGDNVDRWLIGMQRLRRKSLDGAG
ncbi:MAG: hypothetical protein VXW50_05705, partial [Pseudomonadota bacterium]|nr:hypothetical protein [Pseudomonadota bacterium]